jgi:acetate kinase
MASRVLLCLNSGSSSLKFALYRIGDGEETLLAQGVVERDDAEVARLWIHSGQQKIEKIGREMSSISAALHAQDANNFTSNRVRRARLIGKRV